MSLSALVSAVAGVAALSGCATRGDSAAYDAPVLRLMYDPASGRDLSHWPGSVRFDHRHMKLEIVIADMNATRAACRATIELAALGRPRSAVRFDAKGLKISSVALIGLSAGAETQTPLVARADEDQLVIELPRAYNPGEVFSLRIDYAIEYPDGQGVGLTWAAGDASAASPTDQAPMLHSQGQAEWNSTWFPAVDFPNHKLTTELLVTVPDGYTVISNGYLASTMPDAPLDPRPSNAPSVPRAYSRWHWVQDKPHPPYLVSLVVGKFAQVNLRDAGKAVDLSAHDGKEPPLVVFAPIGQESRAIDVFCRTPEMVAFLARYFDEPYPWSKYTQTSVRGFRWGGMENTSATTLMPRIWTDTHKIDYDDLIMHELAHQWVGNLVTCRSWEHAWLNEGWAVYCEALWEGELARARASGPPDDAYLNTVIGWLDEQAKKNPDGVSPPLASRHYASPDGVFEKADDIYGKGALVMHMLRERVGEAAFIAGTRRYIDDHKFGVVEASDFRRALEAASGESLEQFFTQWTQRQGIPRASIRVVANAEEKSVGVEVRQTQRISRERPIYEFELPLRITLADGTTRTISLPVEDRVSALTARFSAPVMACEIDPALSVAGAWQVDKPEWMWIGELQSPSLWSRVQAARALKSLGSPKAMAALRALDLSEAPSTLKQAAE